ncbi:MAG: TatD family hydrolase [Anaerolineae bacterium]|nr:TatD family hydrolase [Anaerolineae bacterium]
MIDTHCHLDFAAFDDDRDAVVARAAAADVTRIINPAVDLAACAAALRLADRYAGVYAAVGIHPTSTASFSPEHLTAVEGHAGHAKVVAIGEIGLDYYWDKSPKDTQRNAFEAQLALAARLDLPVIIHNRDANDDVMTILEQWAAALPPSLRERPGVLHSFSGDMAMAEHALQAGFYLGFTGPLTFKNAEDTRRIAAAVPLDRLLVETDAPFLTPVPYRGKRNEPAYIPYMVERLAALKLIATDEMAAITTQNAERLFQLS